MTPVFRLGIACTLIVAAACTACAPPTPKVERPDPSLSLEQNPHKHVAHSEGSFDR